MTNDAFMMNSILQITGKFPSVSRARITLPLMIANAFLDDDDGNYSFYDQHYADIGVGWQLLVRVE